MSSVQRRVWIIFALVNLVIPTGAVIRCSQCESGQGSSCLTRPPPATDCNGFGYCIVIAKYGLNGDMVSFWRGCSPAFFADSCVKAVDRLTGEPRLLCHKSCSKDGCNGFTYLHHILDLLRRRRRK